MVLEGNVGRNGRATADAPGAGLIETLDRPRPDDFVDPTGSDPDARPLYAPPTPGPGPVGGARSHIGSRQPRSRPTRFAHYPALDGLRALAVLAILAYHDDYQWARGGFLGVDLFFVLSGFLITTLLVTEWNRTGSVALGTFWARRARRLLPALLLALIGVAAFTYFELQPWNRASVRNDGLASLLYVSNWRFIAADVGYFNLFSAPSPLRHMWSLAVEEQFYLVWPLVVYGALRLGRGSLKVLAATCALGTVASVAFMAYAFDHGQPLRAYYGTDARAHTVLLGALLALATLRWPVGARRWWWTAAGSAALVVAAAMMSTASGESWRYYHGGSLLFGLLAVVAVTAAMRPGVLGTVLGWRPLAWVGRLSYGLYLFHWPIVVWVVPSRFDLSPLTLNLLRLVLTFGAAITAYYLVELPVRERRFLHVARRAPSGPSAPRRALPTHARTRRDATRWLALPALAATFAVVVGSSTGASAPPSYLAGERPPDGKGYIWSLGDPLFCGQPRPEETSEARRTASRLGRPGLAGSASGVRVLVLGDSTACSLFPGLQAVGRQLGADVEQGSVFGCGMVTARPTSVRGDQLTPHAERCPAMVRQAQDTAVGQLDPDVIVWTSTWEKADLIIGGRTYVSGTPAGNRVMLGQMDLTLARITRKGARVVVVTSAPSAPNDGDLTDGTKKRIADQSYARLRRIEERFAERHRDQVTLVDLAARVCPGGAPCPAEVDGVNLRPDGRHFTPRASAMAAHWLLPKVVAAAR